MTPGGYTNYRGGNKKRRLCPTRSEITKSTQTDTRGTKWGGNRTSVLFVFWFVPFAFLPFLLSQAKLEFTDLFLRLTERAQEWLYLIRIDWHFRHALFQRVEVGNDLALKFVVIVEPGI